MNLVEFVEKYHERIVDRIEQDLTPVYHPGKETTAFDGKVLSLLRKPFPVQAEVIKGMAKAMFERGWKKLFLCGEMGTGKSTVANSVVHLSPKPLRALVVCPTHLVEKWKREIALTVPDARIIDLSVKEAITKLQRLREAGRPENNEFWVISKERAKLSHGWQAAFNLRRRYAKWYEDDATCPRVVVRTPVCPSCGQEPVDEEGEPIPVEKLRKKKHTCRSCGEPLWQATPNPRRYAPAEFIKRRLKGRFDMVILDEIHEYKAGDSLQGHAMGMLLSCSEYFMGLTGTLSGGYAEDLFYLLYRTDPAALEAFGYAGVENWQRQYGVLEEVEKIDDDDHTYGRQKKRNKVIKRRPGISPEVIGRFFLDKTCFLRLSDVIDSLPPYDEYVISIDLEGEQQAEYKLLERKLSEAVKKYRKLAMASTLQALLSYPDSCAVFPEDIIIRDKEKRPLMEITASLIELKPGVALPKEKELLSIIAEEADEGRKVLVYLVFTGKRDIRGRLKDVIESKGYRVGILPETVEPKKREKWIDEHADEFDVLIANPELVKVGLDLVQFPTIVFFEVGYNIFTLRQAARRSWRIGQYQPVKVYYLCYRGTMQETALCLTAKKLEVATLLEGDLPEGLGQYNGGGGSVMEELMNALIEGRTMTGAETVWANMRKKEVESSLEIGAKETAFTEITTVTRRRRNPMPVTTVTENTMVTVAVIEKGKKKVSRLSVRYGDLETELKGKMVQFQLF